MLGTAKLFLKFGGYFTRQGDAMMDAIHISHTGYWVYSRACWRRVSLPQLGGTQSARDGGHARRAAALANAESRPGPHWQMRKAGPGFTVRPTRAHRQLLVVYRLVFKNVATQEAFKSR